MGNKEQCLTTTHNKTESKVGKIIISTDLTSDCFMEEMLFGQTVRDLYTGKVGTDKRKGRQGRGRENERKEGRKIPKVEAVQTKS